MIVSFRLCAPISTLPFATNDVDFCAKNIKVRCVVSFRMSGHLPSCCPASAPAGVRCQAKGGEVPFLSPRKREQNKSLAMKIV